MFETFTLGFPYAFILLLLFFLFNRFTSQHNETLYLPHIAYYTNRPSVKISKIPLFLKWVLILFTITALSDPIIYKKTTSVKEKSIDIVLALDTSGSMSMYGFNPKIYKQTRLDVVQDVVSAFIDTRTNDHIGLVFFGTYSSIASPLSFDKDALQRIVKGVRIGSLGKSTALIDALVSSVELLRKSPSQSKVIILLSDGEDSSSRVPLPIALKLVEKYGIKIYTIIIDKSASNMMQVIAKSSHTKAYEAQSKEALSKIYTQINQLEKSKIDDTSLLIPQHIYAYFLLIAILAAFGLLLYPHNKGVL